MRKGKNDRPRKIVNKCHQSRTMKAKGLPRQDWKFRKGDASRPFPSKNGQEERRILARERGLKKRTVLRISEESRGIHPRKHTILKGPRGSSGHGNASGVRWRKGASSDPTRPISIVLRFLELEIDHR